MKNHNWNDYDVQYVEHNGNRGVLFFKRDISELEISKSDVIALAKEFGLDFTEIKEDNERYFLIKYVVHFQDREITGTTFYEDKEFPFRSILIKKLSAQIPHTDRVTIESVFEFKSKEDYDNFRK